MTTRLAPAVLILATLAAAWFLAGAIARADAPRVAASNYIKNSNSSATATPAWDGRLVLPFDVSEGWRFTGGNHQPWMAPGDPPVALDWAPPSNWTTDKAACDTAPEWARAIMPGTVTRADDGRVWLEGPDGWAALYLHMDAPVAVGTVVEPGDPIGHPSCVGSRLRSDGAHVHLAVWRNGAFVSPVLDGWAFEPAGFRYQGAATRGSERVCSIQLAATEQGCSSEWPTGREGAGE